MKTPQERLLWFYPMLFGILGAFLGLLTRYLFTGVEIELPLKNFVHSHSHVMLLGFLFNALVILLWSRFTNGIDKLSYHYFIALQVCVVGMLVTFIIQGYALFSIIFSTVHLWISYIFLIRLWNRLNQQNGLSSLVKIGVVFHFLSSIGPYCLGPLMVFEMQNSPWYQQAIFFYLHFQFFGSLFLWLIALWLQKEEKTLNKTSILLLSLSIIGMFAHSLNYSFDHWLINIVGGLSSVLLLIVLIPFLKQKIQNNFIHYMLLLIGFLNVMGSIPSIAEIVIENHFALIAWLHFLFLGLYVPFIWLKTPIKINGWFWAIYTLVFLFSEFVLLFPELSFQVFGISIMWLLFIVYCLVFICFCMIHFQYIFFKRQTF